MKKTRIIKVLLLMLIFVCFHTTNVKAASKYTIYVSRKTNIVNVVNTRTNQLVRSMYCSTGKNYSTITGKYNTVSKMRWHPMFGGVWAQYCTRIHGHYLFHSVGYTSPSLTKQLTKEYNKLGSQASLGCVRLAVVDAKWLYDNCSTGTRVVINDSRSLKKPSREKVKVSTRSKTGWDPTDPVKSNPYYPKLQWKKGVDGKIEYGKVFDITRYIKAKSKVSTASELKDYITYTGKVKIKKPGRYTITAKITDPKTELTTLKKFTFTVKDKVVADTAQ